MRYIGCGICIGCGEIGYVDGCVVYFITMLSKMIYWCWILWYDVSLLFIL